MHNGKVLINNSNTNVHIRTMLDTDIPLGMRLKAQAGWNQTEADWRRMLALQPEGCFVAEWQGEPAGTLTTCIFPEEAWIAMVLVDERRRGCGIGTALLEHALAFLDARGVASVRLDATPMGQPLYERLGFAAEYALTRYAGIPAPAPESAAVQPYAPAQREALLRLDRQLLGIDRGKLLWRLLQEYPEQGRIVLRGQSPVAYLLARPGAHAWQLGPCLAGGEDGLLLLSDAWRRFSGQAVLLDIPLANTPALAGAEAMGLTRTPLAAHAPWRDAYPASARHLGHLRAGERVRGLS